MYLILLSYACALAGAVWLLLPVTHWPGYTDNSLLSTDFGLGALLFVLIPTAIVTLGALGDAFCRRGRWVLGLVLLWTAAVLLLAINVVSQALGPFFIPSALLLVIETIRQSWGRSSRAGRRTEKDIS